MRKLAFALCLLAAPAFAEGAQGLVNETAVTVNNRSTPELCAERDNVALEFVSPEFGIWRCRRPIPPISA